MSFIYVLVIYILIMSLIILCNWLVEYTYYKEPLNLILRRRKAYLLKQKATKEFKYWVLLQKSYSDYRKEENRKASVRKLKIDLFDIDKKLDDVNEYLKVEKGYLDED